MTFLILVINNGCAILAFLSTWLSISMILMWIFKAKDHLFTICMIEFRAYSQFFFRIMFRTFHILEMKTFVFLKNTQYIDILITEFKYYSRWEKTAVSMKMFCSPFSIDVVTVSEDFQMELIGRQNYRIPIKKCNFFSVNIANFYESHVSPEKFPLLTKNAM